MNGLRRHFALALARLGAAGMLGALLLVFAAGLAGLVLFPALQRETELQQRLAQQEASLRAAQQARERGDEETPQARLARFYDAFPGQETLPSSLEKLHVLAAEQSLTLDQAQYKLAQEASGRLARYEITVPAAGAYPQLRRFVERTLAELPALGLRDLRLKRDAIGKDSVEATLQFVLYVRSG